MIKLIDLLKEAVTLEPQLLVFQGILPEQSCHIQLVPSVVIGSSKYKPVPIPQEPDTGKHSIKVPVGEISSPVAVATKQFKFTDQVVEDEILFSITQKIRNVNQRPK